MNAGTSILSVEGLQMIGESNFEDLHDINLDKIVKYVPHEYESKSICFFSN